MTTNSKLMIEQKITSFVKKLYDKKIINSDGIAKRRDVKERYHFDLKRKPVMEGMTFQEFLETIKKHDLILDDKVEGNLQFIIENIASCNENTEAQPTKTDKTENKSSSESLILSSPDSIELAYVTTFRQLLKNFIPTPRSCTICKMKFNAETEYIGHFNEHGKMFMIRPSELTKKIDRMFGFIVEIDQEASTINLTLINHYTQLLNVTEIFLFSSTTQLVSITNGKTMDIMPSESWTFLISDTNFDISNCKYSLLIKSKNVVFEFVEQYHVTMKKPVSRLRHMVNASRVILQFKELKNFQIPDTIKNLSEIKFNEKKVGTSEERYLLNLIKNYNLKPIADRMTKENYVEMLKTMNQIEDYHLVDTFRQYTCYETKLIPCYTNEEHVYILSTEESKFDVSSTILKPKDKVIITANLDQMITGVIDQIIQKNIVIKTQESVPDGIFVNVKFMCNRFTLFFEYEALEMVKQQKISHLFFPELPAPKILLLNQFNWFNRDIVTNLEQITAVQNIVNDTAFPAPYILFGPPGTGKTSTLVEAICQIYTLKPGARILITAETNYACNEVDNRLLRYIPKHDIFRYFSRSSEKFINELDNNVLSRSNFDLGSYRVPFYDEIKKSRIVICTLSTSGRLVQANIEPNLFDYIFIDECGSAKEVSSLIPLAGLAISEGKFNAKVILAGDPKQLGPVIRDEMAENMGLSISMLERLMYNKIYQKNETNEYNNQLITKLLENYRSHEAILQFSNERFYDGELNAMAKVEITDWALNWSKLPVKDFPIIFHYVFGTTMRDMRSSSLSLFNKKEIRMVKIYLQTLLTEGINGNMVDQSDVGVISPYSKQVQKIKEMCYNRDWKDVKVGTTEEFQGREKKIIIFSTVRSKTKTLGFLKNEKRLNVALTRAQSLLIVIGNPTTLSKNDGWKNFLDYCVNNVAIRGLEDTSADVTGIKEEVDYSKEQHAQNISVE